MNEERWNNLCSEGINNASCAYNCALNASEEYLAVCFKILFTLLKESWKGDCQIKESIKKEPININ